MVLKRRLWIPGYAASIQLIFSFKCCFLAHASLVGFPTTFRIPEVLVSLRHVLKTFCFPCSFLATSLLLLLFYVGSCSLLLLQCIIGGSNSCKDTYSLKQATLSCSHCSLICKSSFPCFSWRSSYERNFEKNLLTEFHQDLKKRMKRRLQKKLLTLKVPPSPNLQVNESGNLFSPARNPEKQVQTTAVHRLSQFLKTFKQSPVI